MKKLIIPIGLLTLGLILGYYAGRYSSEGRATKQASAAGVKLGPWAANLRIPGSVQMPNTNPLIRCDFPKIHLDIVDATITNLTNQSYSVSYQIRGYDAKGLRVSDGNDEFVIGGHESVVRQIHLESQAMEFRKGFQDVFGRTFQIEVELQE